MKCKDCKYWKHLENNEHYGNCESEKLIYGSYSDDEEKTNDKLFYMDSEYYKAYVEVGENFGCVHFNQKEGKGG